MTDKKDAPPKGQERPTPESPGAGTKRPYATLDLTATEVASAGPKHGDEQPGPTAKPAAPGSGSAKATVATAQEQSNGSQAAASRIAAAAASLRQSSGHASAGDNQSARADRPSASQSTDEIAGETGGAGMRRYATHLAAGVLGGLVAVLGSQLLASRQPATPLVGGDTVLRDVQQKLAALEKSVAERPAAALPSEATQRLEAIETGLAQLDGVNRSLGTLREEQAKLSEQTDALQRSSADRDAAGRLDKVEEQIATLSAAANADPQTAARIGQAAQVTARLGELETATTARLEALRDDLTKEIDARISGVAEASATAQSIAQRLEQEAAGGKSDATRVSRSVEVLRASTDRMEQSLRTLQTDAGSLNVALEKLRSEIEARLAGTAKTGDIASAVQPVAAKVAALETSLQGVERAEDARKANAERIVLSLELANLKRAMDRGGSYAAELAAVKTTAGGRIELGALERYQHDGVATPADLAGDFRGVANAILDADAEQPDASLVDRLLSGARTIVRVRKVTHAADDTSTEAIVGRIETAVGESRLADALAEAKKLPAKAAVPAQDWINKVEARQSVEAALANVDSELKASLGGTAPGQKDERR